jgi:hypothetical protein
MSPNEETNLAAEPAETPTPAPSRSRADIARENGAKSRGPVTPDGKRRSSQNATKHGLYSTSALIRGEDPAAREQMFMAFYNDVAPDGAVETELVHDLADAAWRKRRYRRIEAELIDEAFEHRDTTEPEPGEPSILSGPIGRALADANRFAARAVREFRQTLQELRALRRDRDRSAALAARRMYAGHEGVRDAWARPVPLSHGTQMEAYAALHADAYDGPPATESNPAEPTTMRVPALADREASPGTGRQAV